MEVDKEKIVNAIVEKIQISCNELVTKPYKENDSNDNYLSPLPATKIEIKNIVRKIITAIPPYYFTIDETTTSVIIDYIVSEYILFQAQEDITDELYPQYLSNFINELRDEMLDGIIKTGVAISSKKDIKIN
ncbi:MAG: hypothetical protein HRT87_05010 [Legionellales bacterium]|nr:hypothetical protein [Legionellales bacterium]